MIKASDPHDLFIGILGGLIVIVVLAVSKVIRDVGLRGVRHFWRSQRIAELRLISGFTGKLDFMVMLSYVQTQLLGYTLWFVFGIYILTVIAEAHLFNDKYSLLTAAIGGMWGGLLSNAAVDLAFARKLMLGALAGKDALVEHLMARASLSPEDLANLPADNRPNLGHANHPP